MKDDYTTNSHYLTHTFLFRKVGRRNFLNLGVKGLTAARASQKGTCAFVSHPSTIDHSALRASIVFMRSCRSQSVFAKIYIHIMSTLPLSSSKSTFSQPFEEKCISEVVRIDSIIIFHLSKLWKARFFILCGCYISGELAAEEIWYWPLLGVRGLLRILASFLLTSSYLPTGLEFKVRPLLCPLSVSHLLPRTCHSLLTTLILYVTQEALAGMVDHYHTHILSSRFVAWWRCSCPLCLILILLLIYRAYTAFRGSSQRWKNSVRYGRLGSRCSFG